VDTDVGKAANYTAQNKCDEMFGGEKLIHTNHHIGDGSFTISAPLREEIWAA
jgi:hypothetical protein